MGESHILEPRSAFARLRRVLLFAGTVAVFACGGDTLYDAVAPDVDPPSVLIVEPSSGAEVLAGQRVPIRIEASDPLGVSSITVRTTGEVSSTITIEFTPPRTTVAVDTAIVVPEGAAGSVQIAATAVNARGVTGQATPVNLSVTSDDIVPPDVGITVRANARMELTDEISVTVEAVDNPGGSGITRTAMTALVRNTARLDTVVVTREEEFTIPREDTVISEFSFQPPSVDSLNLPDTLYIDFFGLAYDENGNCSGAVDSELGNEIVCDTVVVGGIQFVIANAVPESQEVIAVSGRTSLVPGGGTLADILVDTLREKVYASNLGRNRINTLRAGPATWDSEVFVGAEPWGLAINAGGDSLFVANSGGTSLSFVSLSGTPREDLSRRFVTQNTPLFEISRERDEVTGLVKLSGVFFDFSDRPQFIAQDARGRLLYSTRPTPSAPEGTIRIVTHEPGWASPEAKILLLAEDVQFDTSTVAIAHVDSIFLFSVTGGDDLVEIFDHKPGFPDVLVRSGVVTLDDALATMSANPDSDILWANGSWVRERLAFEDTTFVAASGDREWVAFGEGGTQANRAGRITLWDSDASKIHSRLLVVDLLNNASERVTGLDLNVDGTLGAARGRFASYYWRTDLRLVGSVTTSVDGGAGAALHVDHPSYGQGLPSSDRTLSFVGQSDYTVRILDTVHFSERGEIHIRDNIVGPLRVGPPLAVDNGGQGRNCSGDNCVVLKLYAITDAGGIVIVNVRRRDIGPLQ
jgi:DNA-binding beta-propeller fold protein YncE